MEWFNFSDTTFLISFIVCVTLVGLLLFFIISYSVSNRGEFSFSKKLKKESVTSRIYVVDLGNNSVVYFNKSDMRTKHHIDVESFYQRFHQNDIDKVKKWIYSISTDYKNAEQYIEADVTLDHGKASYFSLLKLTKYNPNIGIIHLESVVLKYITPINFISKSRKNAPVAGVVKRSIVEELVTKEKGLKGFTFAIRFFYLRQKILSNDKIERYMIMTLKNEVYPYASTSKYFRQIVDDGDNELLLFDLKIDNRDEAMRLATSIAHSINKSIGVNGYVDSVNFSIGVVENSLFYQDFETIVTKAQESCVAGQQNGNEIFYYQKQAGALIDVNKYKEEVANLMKPNGIRYLFRPIVDIVRKKTIGYFQNVRAYDSVFASFSEMNKFAAKVGMNRELFATIAKYVIPKFANEVQDETMRLFFMVSMLNIDHMATILPQVPHINDIHIVLMFDEQEINENSSSLELLNNSLNSLKNDGYEIAMLMKDRDLLLDPSVYGNFDYFITGASMLGEIKKNNRIRLSIHTLIEQLLKYNRPIIATDLESWQSVELIIKSGITMVSGETIAASNDMLLPVDKKKMDKVVSMGEN